MPEIELGSALWKASAPPAVLYHSSPIIFAFDVCFLYVWSPGKISRGPFSLPSGIPLFLRKYLRLTLPLPSFPASAPLLPADDSTSCPPRALHEHLLCASDCVNDQTPMSGARASIKRQLGALRTVLQCGDTRLVTFPQDFSRST